MDTVECIVGRQSVRAFSGAPVDRATVTALVEAAANVPSWKNAQPTRYTLVEDGAVREKIIADMVPDYNARILKNAAAVVCVSALRKRSGYERDGTPTTVHGDGYEFFDCGVATQTLCLAAWNRGIGSVILGIFDVARVAEAIGVPAEEDLVAIVALGVPSGETAKVKKKDAAALLRFV